MENVKCLIIGTGPEFDEIIETPLRSGIKVRFAQIFHHLALSQQRIVRKVFENRHDFHRQKFSTNFIQYLQKNILKIN